MTTSPVEGERRKKADTLAKAFLATLCAIERKEVERRGNRAKGLAQGDDAVEQVFVEADGKHKIQHVPVRADLAAVAVLVARAIAAVPGLMRELRREAPILTVETHTAELVELVEEVFRLCVFAKGTHVRELGRDPARLDWRDSAVILVRDGSSKLHTNNVGNDLVGKALHHRIPVVGIAPDPAKILPRDLNRAAEAKLSLPPFDASALAIVFGAVLGASTRRRLDEALVRTLDIADLPVALRRCQTPDEAIDAVARVLSEKAEYLHAGPSLRDLHGYGAAQDWGLALAQDLQLYRTGLLSWRDIDSRSLLLTGPPGVGKTSFAKAVAKECNVPLVATSVSEWNAAEYLSGTLRRMREVFATAKSRAPCILFIDELDGISNRSGLGGDYIQYWIQIVNCFLELLSGVEAIDGVIVIAATNFPHLIDPAVTRAGRIDRQIEISKPDTKTLCAIFRQYVKDEIPANVSLIRLAVAARGHTGADVESWVRRARGSARRAGNKLDLDGILMEIRAGRPPLLDEARRRIALHEAGHIIANLELKLGAVVDVSLHDGGGEAQIEADIAGDATADRVESCLSVLLAGRSAEMIGLGDASIGGASDLGKATQIARDLELRFGMGVIGPVQIEPYAGEMLLMRGLLDAVEDRLRKAEDRARTILQERWTAVEAVATALEDSGYLAAGDIETLVQADARDRKGATRVIGRES